MKSKPHPNMLRSVEFKIGGGKDLVVGFCIDESDSFLKVAATYGNQGFTDITKIDKSKIVKLNRLIFPEKHPAKRKK